MGKGKEKRKYLSPSVPFSCEAVLISCFPKGREGKFEGLRGVKTIVHAQSLRYL